MERCFEANSTFSANFEFKGWGAIGSFSFTYSKSVWQKTCYDIQCKDCSRGYSIERVTKDSFGGGASWNLPIPNPASPLKIPIGYSYSLSGGEHYFYNSCTGFEVFESCHSLTLSGSVGASIGLGRFISYRVALTFSYEWTDCGGEKTEIAINGTLEQCYVGMCWSIDFPLKQWGF